MKTLNRKLKFIIVVLLLQSISAFAYITQAGHIDIKSAIINEVITNMYSSKQVNDYTCESVQKFSQGKITKEDCESNIKKTNDTCASLAREQYDYLDLDNNPEQLIRILVSCPVAKILGYSYEVVRGEPEVLDP